MFKRQLLVYILKNVYPYDNLYMYCMSYTTNNYVYTLFYWFFLNLEASNNAMMVTL